MSSSRSIRNWFRAAQPSCHGRSGCGYYRQEAHVPFSCPVWQEHGIRPEACHRVVHGLLTSFLIIYSIIQTAEVLAGDSAGSLGRPSSSKPPNPFQRLALIIGRLGLQCMRMGQMLGSKIMGALIQAMRGMLRLRGR